MKDTFCTITWVWIHFISELNNSYNNLETIWKLKCYRLHLRFWKISDIAYIIVKMHIISVDYYWWHAIKPPGCDFFHVCYLMGLSKFLRQPPVSQCYAKSRIQGVLLRVINNNMFSSYEHRMFRKKKYINCKCLSWKSEVTFQADSIITWSGVNLNVCQCLSIHIEMQQETIS